MTNLFKSGVFWTLLLSFIFALVIIFVFPYFFESFESLSYRIFVALAVFFTMLTVVLLYILFLEEKTQAMMAARKERLAKERAKKKIINDKVKDIKGKFFDALKIVKSSSLYRHKRRTRYELPWYLVVGQEDEGKTSLLEASGLEFPLNISFSEQKAKETGRSKAFQWYYAEHAVFIDVPGNYISQNDSEEDATVWEKGFLKIFAKKRNKRPLNGIVLNISVDTFLNNTERELEKYAKNLRDRFDELSKGFVSSIPIYLVVTKSDNIEGFSEYFSFLSEDEKDEILGITFDNPGTNIDTSVMQPKFHELLKRLNSSVIDKLQNEWDENARSKLYLFTDSFSDVFERINIFTDICFAQTRYRRPLMLRGVYFTSVPKAKKVATSYLINSTQEAGSLSNARETKGLFVKNLLEDVIFPEADLIKMDTNFRRSNFKRQSVAIFVAFVLVSVFAFFSAKDFISHNNLLHSLEKDFIAYELNKDKLGTKNNFEDIALMLNDINDLKQKHIDETSNAFYKIKFYDADEQNIRLINLYHKSLVQQLLPRVEKLLNSQILTNLKDYDRTWKNLEAYLMLNDKKHRDDGILKTVLSDYWARMYPNKPSIQRSLNNHWSELLAFDFDAVKLNKNTLKVARTKLVSKGYVAITYDGLKNHVNDTMNFKDFTLSQILNSNSNAFTGSDFVIPGFYTKEGYTKVILAEGKDIVKTVLLNNWVIGENVDLTRSQVNDVYSKVLSYYFKDYKKYWLTAINSLNVDTKKSISSLTNELEAFSSADSPILAVLQAVKLNTDIYSSSETLIKKAKSGKIKIKLNKIAKLAARNAIKKAEKDMPSTSVRNVRKFFEPFNKLTNEDNSMSPDLQNAMTKLDDVFKEMSSIYGAIDIHESSYNIVRDRINGKHESIVISFSALPVQVSKWHKTILKSNWNFLLSQAKNHIAKKYKENVMSYYDEKIKGKYPIQRKNYTQGIDLVDFTEFFKSEGVMDTFYKTYVHSFVRLNKATYRSFSHKVIDGSIINFSLDFMRNILKTYRIRKVMFKDAGKVLGATISIKPHVLEKNLGSMRMTYDNSSIVYEHGPIRENILVWPRNGSNNEANFSMYDLLGTQLHERSKIGDWALFQLIDTYNVNPINSKTIAFTYKQDKYFTSTYFRSNISTIFTKDNPMDNFILNGKL